MFVPMEPIVQRVIQDPADPSYPLRSFDEWRGDFERRWAEAVATARRGEPDEGVARLQDPAAPPVGLLSEESLKRFASRRAAEARRAERQNVALERLGIQGVEPRE